MLRHVSPGPVHGVDSGMACVKPRVYERMGHIKPARTP
jgi:hypothetical protein